MLRATDGRIHRRCWLLFVCWLQPPICNMEDARKRQSISPKGLHRKLAAKATAPGYPWVCPAQVSLPCHLVGINWALQISVRTCKADELQKHLHEASFWTSLHCNLKGQIPVFCIFFHEAQERCPARSIELVYLRTLEAQDSSVLPAVH